MNQRDVETDLKSASAWNDFGGTYGACGVPIPSLPAGIYKVNIGLGVFFERHEIVSDTTFKIPESISAKVIDEIEAFWQKAERYREFGIAHKRGFLLHGPPGTGKTATIKTVVEKFVADGGIALIVSNSNELANGVSIVRKVEPTRKIVVIMEDFEIIVMNSDEHQLLSVLDGEHSIDGVVFIATTNHLKNLEPRFRCRPSRFDRVLAVGLPTKSQRKFLVSKKLPKASAEEIAAIVAKTDKLSIAQIKEVIVANHVYDVKLEEAVKRVREMGMIDSNDPDADYDPDDEPDDEIKSLPLATGSAKAELKPREMLERMDG